MAHRTSTLVVGIGLLALLAGCGAGDTFATTLRPVIKVEPPIDAHDGQYVVQGMPARFRVTWACGLPPHLQADYADNCWLEATFPNELQPCELSCESTYVYEFLEPTCDTCGLHTLTVTLHENRHWVEERRGLRAALDAEAKDLEAQIAGTLDPDVLALLQAQLAERKDAIAALDAEIAALAVPIATGTLSIQVVAPLTLDTDALPDATDGRLYAADVAGTGGLAPYTWSAVGLPERMAIREATAGAAPTTVIEGWAEEYGTCPVTVNVADGTGQTASFTCDLVVKPVVITVYFCGSGESVEDWNVKDGRPQLLPSLHHLDRSRYRLEIENDTWSVHTQPDIDCTTSYRAAVRGVSTVKPPNWVDLEADWSGVLAGMDALKLDLDEFINLDWEGFFVKLANMVTRIVTLSTSTSDLEAEGDNLIAEIMKLGGEHQTLAEVMNLAANLDPSNENLKRGWAGCQTEGRDAIERALAHEGMLAQLDGCPFTVRPLLNLVGYSRGAVQCMKMAREWADDDRLTEINIISMDPAPGEAGQNPELRWPVLEDLVDFLVSVREGLSDLDTYVDDLLAGKLSWTEFWDGLTTQVTNLETAVENLIAIATPPHAEWWTNIQGATTLHDLQDDAVLPPKVSRFVGIYAEDERSYRFEPLVPIREDEDATLWWTVSVPGSHQTMTNRIMQYGHAPVNFYWHDTPKRPLGGGESVDDYKYVVAVVFRTCETLLSSPAWGGLSFGDFSDAGGSDVDPEPAPLLGLSRSDATWEGLITDMQAQDYTDIHLSSFLPRIACWRPDLRGCFSRVSGGSDSVSPDQPYVLEWNFQPWPGSSSDPVVGPLDERVCFRALRDPPSASEPEIVYSLPSTVSPIDKETIDANLERMTVFPVHPSVP